MHLLKNREKVHITTREGMPFARQTRPASRATPHIFVISDAHVNC